MYTAQHVIQPWSQTWIEEEMGGVHYIHIKGHLFMGVRAKVPSLKGWKGIGYDGVKPKGHIFHL